jgi:hypothetical protein
MRLNTVLYAFALSSALVPLASAQDQSPRILTVGQGTAELNGLLQAWTLYDDTTSRGEANIRLRRAEIKLSGSVAENTRWFLMVDPSKSIKVPVTAANDNRVLQDFGIGFGLGHRFELVAGQFKTPATAEGLDSSSELLLPERAYVARAFGDKREPGLMLSWVSAHLKASLMASNGQNTNIDDTDSDKDITLRVDASPFEGWKLGAFTAAGNYDYDAKGRWGMNARYSSRGWLARFEGVRGKAGRQYSTGWVADLAYTIAEKWQPALRFDQFIGGGFRSNAGSVGLNYLLARKNAKIQAAYTELNRMAGNNGSGALGTYVPDRNSRGKLFILSLQMAI